MYGTSEAEQRSRTGAAIISPVIRGFTTRGKQKAGTVKKLRIFNRAARQIEVTHIPRLTVDHTVNVVHKHMPRPMPGNCAVTFTTRKGETYSQPGFHMTGQAFQRFNIPPYEHPGDPWQSVELRFWYDPQ